MSRVATYLQGHIDGDVSTHLSDRQLARDSSGIFTLEPELVVYPRTTNDIRKVARFGWQLATKGHVLPITARGGGSDDSGAALSRGAVIATATHMNTVLEFDVRQRLVRLQPGVRSEALQTALRTHGMYLPALADESSRATIGGAIASNATSHIGKYGSVIDTVEQLEIVLSNGDVIQTGRLSRRDVQRKKGEQTFEGELYRALSNLLDDNAALIQEKIDTEVWDGAGYATIARIRARDGSMDLTPLFVGSQGSLGIIAEAIVKATYYHQPHVAAIAFQSAEAARDALDMFNKLEPASLEYLDGRFVAAALEQGKKYDWLKGAAALVLVTFDDSSDATAKRKLKRVAKTFAKAGASIKLSSPNQADLLALRDLPRYSWHPTVSDTAGVPLFDGVFVPNDRREDFVAAVEAMAAKHHNELPLVIDALSQTFTARPLFDVRKGSDKQKIVKFISEYATIVDQHGGHLVGHGGEGRLKATAAQQFIEPDVVALYAEVKKIFDPYSMFNTGIKQPLDTRAFASLIKTIR